MGFNWLAAAVTALFAWFIIKGYRKGFLRIAVSLAGTLVVVAGAAIISPGISSSLINNSRIYDDLERELIESYNKRIAADGIADDRPEENADNPRVISIDVPGYDHENDDLSEEKEKTISADDFGIPQIMMDDIVREFGKQLYNELAVTIFEKYIAGYIAALIIRSSTFMIVSAILSAAVWFLLKTTNLISRIPVIKGFNRTLGCAAGALEALLIVWAAFFIIVMCLGNNFGEKLLGYVRDSVFLTILFNNNILFRIISGH